MTARGHSLFAALRKFSACFFFLAFAPVGTWAGDKALLEIENAHASFDQITNKPVVSIKFVKSSAPNLVKISSANVGKPMQFRVNGQIIAKAVVREPLIGGSVQISQELTIEKAQDIANRLRPGSTIEAEIVDE